MSCPHETKYEYCSALRVYVRARGRTSPLVSEGWVELGIDGEELRLSTTSADIAEIGRLAD